jgi:predicted transcriptional regulator
MTTAAEKVKDVMARHPSALRTGTDLTAAVDQLLKLKVTGLPIVDASERVVGFLSEQDCLRSLIVSSYHCEGSPSVDDVMHAEVLSVRPDDALMDVAEMMVKQKPKIYPVVDESGCLVGMLTRGQVLGALKDMRRACDLG